MKEAIGRIEIKNRSLTHYLLCLCSLAFRGVDVIQVRSCGSMIGKATDLANLLTTNLLPQTFRTAVDHTVGKVKAPYYGVAKMYKASIATISLSFLDPVAKILDSDYAILSGADSEPLGSASTVNVFDLELLLAVLARVEDKPLQLVIEKIDKPRGITPFDLHLAQLDLRKLKLILGDDVVYPERGLEDASLSRKNRDEAQGKAVKLRAIRSAFDNALIRTGILKPNLDEHRFHLSQWDDVILGLDTNMFYYGAPTAYLLDSLMKIPSGDFIDTPDWITLVVSKVTVAEIENKAIVKTDDAPWARREAFRAIQEIMIVNRSKDLEGVSLFLVGSVPPEIDFSSGQSNTMRDFLIREHFRAFLKQLDFFKGSYFVSSDFNTACLAEAEGLASLYVKKPTINRSVEPLPLGEISASELLYEMTVAFHPLVIKGEKIELSIYSDWRGKTLADWENLDLHVEWRKDEVKAQSRFNMARRHTRIAGLNKACEDLRYRYVTWHK